MPTLQQVTAAPLPRRALRELVGIPGTLNLTLSTEHQSLAAISNFYSADEEVEVQRG